MTEHGMPVLVVADSPLSAGRVLVDPNAWTGTAQYGIDWFYPSPDGSLVAFGISANGNEQTVLYVVVTVTGSLLSDTIEGTTMCTITWLPDGQSFYYTRLDGGSAAGINTRLYVHKIGDNTDVPLDYPAPRDGFLYPQLSGDGRYLLGVDGFVDARPSYLRDMAAADGVWHPFLRDKGALYIGQFVGDDYVAITTDGSPRGRVVAIPLKSEPDVSTWRELVAESDAVLLSLVHIGDRLILGELVDCTMRLRVLALDSAPLSEVPLPGRGIIGTSGSSTGSPGRAVVQGNTEANTLTFIYSSLVESPALYEYDLTTDRLTRLTTPLVEHPTWIQRQEFVTARDGTRISVFIAERGDLDQHSSRPTLLHAYGGFNAGDLPNYMPELEPFINAGGRVAIVNARGGSEYGREWYLGGIMENKHVTFDDICDVASWFITQGLAEREQLALSGRSNGGYTTAATAARCPDLFRVVIPVVAVLDQMRVTREPFVEAMGLCEEGTPRDPRHASRLYDLSPYHNLRENEVYPATLTIACENDLRCPPWHSRKFTAQLQANAADDRPMLLLVARNAGHFGITGLTPDQWLEITSAWVGFLMRELGLSVVSA
jgi:prolyl oligopeptidase